MRILVQKFGGTSLSDAQARTHAIRHIKQALADSYQLVVVVSAMGRKGEPYATDSLLELIRHNGNCLPAREKDLLLHCGEIISAAVLCSLLEAENVPAVVLTGAQAGIRTNDRFGDARIESIQPSRIVQALSEGKVAVVPGFQGETAHGDITTLGRGGSDTTATALGAALRAECVDIFTDVNGIFTADPRIVSEAKPIERVTYAEICNMAYQGAKVIHPRAVEVAMEAGVPIRVRSTFSDDEGTLVTRGDEPEGADRRLKDRFVTGIAHVAPVTQIKVAAQEGQYDLSLNVFKTMAQHQISVDFINVNVSGVTYTVFAHESERAIRVLNRLGYEPETTEGCAKVSVIGGGMNGVPGIMAHIVEALTKNDIPILQSADSNATIWVLVKESDMAKAIQALHQTFQLDKP
ncbi:aspartate kinase [Paenibacillus flagellatus]|uniref:Aspartokinase n=1 Tax=Paenibacillus flagellatus TaxID=2211139 RepID=A0A2V5KPJ1_9BACL|nr:aspartate kinase [Paenibacillus flagellatus]PYI50426.1 aspartate kinase [Paenibacillus flagellatus]